MGKVQKPSDSERPLGVLEILVKKTDTYVSLNGRSYMTMITASNTKFKQ
jgi:hypothetical protein